jgi:8-oxo-dGTP pyrophosphatase MutT (NUDIX family)|tara:strand:+ start:670 stop:1098 length:429 start_codon:yes stop_codon:yes gene_type:complete
MENNIICSGALFYSTSTKRFLFLQRTSEKTKGMWGLVGGRMKYTESAFEGLKREIQEEIGNTPTFKKVIPLELFTSNDQKFYFHTYLVAVTDEFLPKLNQEHSGYCWCAFECWPKNLHGGLRNTLNNKAIKGKLQTILDLIT